MALSESDIRQVKEAVRQEMETWLEGSGLNTHSHAQDHEFLSQWRENTCTVKRASIWAIVTVIVTGVIGLIWTALRGG